MGIYLDRSRLRFCVGGVAVVVVAAQRIHVWYLPTFTIKNNQMWAYVDPLGCCSCFASSQPIRIVVVVGQGQWGFYLCGMSDLSCP